VLAHYWRDDPTKRDRLLAAENVFMTEVPTAGTRHYGEGYVIVNLPGCEFFEAHVAVPHIGASAQNFIASAFIYGMEQPDDDDDDAQDDDIADDDDDDSECGC